MDYRDLTIENIQNQVRKKIDEAISDADKSSAEYKYYDIHKLKILSNLKKPIKDNPYLDSFSNEALRTICCMAFWKQLCVATIKHRRKSQYIKLDISVSSSPISKRDRISMIDTPKIDSVVQESSLVIVIP